MKLLIPTAGLLLILMAAPMCFAAEEPIHHDLQVELHPDEHRFTAVDAITPPVSSAGETELVLHAGLEPRTSSLGARMEKVIRNRFLRVLGSTCRGFRQGHSGADLLGSEDKNRHGVTPWWWE